jgi:two-component sensor histidine kinase
VRGEIDSATEQHPYTGNHGRRWWAEVTTTAIRDAPDAQHPTGRFLHAVRVVQDITERKQAEERQALLLAELSHRVKNSLAVVQSLAAQTARGAADLPYFSAAFQARLIALARAHDLLARRAWEGAALGAVVRAALDPLAADDARVDLSGCAPGVVLTPAAALALTMVVHELAANALRHGALSVAQGSVAVACHDADAGGGGPIVEWVERGGPPIAGSPARRGFGLRLLENGLTAEAGIRGDIRFEPEGVRCTLRLPPTRVVPGVAVS